MNCDIPELAFQSHIFISKIFIITDIVKIISILYFQLKYRALKSDYLKKLMFIPLKELSSFDLLWRKYIYDNNSRSYDYETIKSYFNGKTIAIFREIAFSENNYDYFKTLDTLEKHSKMIIILINVDEYLTKIIRAIINFLSKNRTPIIFEYSRGKSLSNIDCKIWYGAWTLEY